LFVSTALQGFGGWEPQNGLFGRVEHGKGERKREGEREKKSQSRRRDKTAGLF
jgi:hypothetical protein